MSLHVCEPESSLLFNCKMFTTYILMHNGGFIANSFIKPTNIDIGKIVLKNSYMDEEIVTVKSP